MRADPVRSLEHDDHISGKVSRSSLRDVAHFHALHACCALGFDRSNRQVIVPIGPTTVMVTMLVPSKVICMCDVFGSEASPTIGVLVTSTVMTPEGHCRSAFGLGRTRLLPRRW